MMNIIIKIRDLLSEIVYEINPDHHFGRPFITAYQLALKFADKYPKEVASMGIPMGGKGSGHSNSLPQYFAKELSRRIKDKSITDIEGGFISSIYTKDLVFNNHGTPLYPAVEDISVFRLRME